MFAYLRSTSFKTGPCLGSAGLLSIIGIYSSGLNAEKVLNMDLRDAFLWTDFLLDTHEILFLILKTQVSVAYVGVHDKNNKGM